ncbi:probable low-specificity L-threonine aldolase 2 isoform X3 [Amblyraja radiata]|uniref:probable low-specificity L-threonine aldolase 2 isoform X3 n=1 Tax=Amblyraja radiata TaxID=386614 RepID=UPI0014039AAC|nr:probable low-specificity L-threonine aldolase 2 isoform X3 [Amblyraja radiata]
MRSGLLRLPAAGRRWYRGSGHRAEAGPHRVIDLRSDTVSRPGAAMRAAMGSAAVGDDVYGEDPTVNELQRRAAQLFGMEAALFVPTGTMGNLISVMCHCWERGTELIVGDRAHIHIFEQGGGAQIAGVHSRVVKNLPDGTFDLNELESNIRHDYPDPHVTRTSLICLENTHNVKGGRVLPLPFLQEGLGSPVGSIIGGRKDFIERAVRLRKVLGGGMRQAGVLAAAGLISISDMVDRLKEDHRNARTFAQGIKMYATPFCEVDVDTVETNILLFTINSPHATAEEFCRRMGEVSEEEVAETGRGVRVLLFPIYGHILRAVWHLDVSEEDTHLALRKLQFVVNKLEQQST